MSLPDELLMAYADGEADEPTRERVERAMRDDPAVARRVEAHRALRATLRGAFSAVLDEPVPQRLIDAALAAGSRGPAPVSLIAEARAARAARAPRVVHASRRTPVALAASLLLGVGVGYLAWHSSEPILQQAGGGLVAGRALGAVLDRQLAGDPATSTLATVGLSFRAKDGEFCRTFRLAGATGPAAPGGAAPGARARADTAPAQSAAPAAGLACREGRRWRIDMLQRADADADDAAGPQYRMASSAMPAALAEAVAQAMDGEPLDRRAENAARDAGWNRATSSPRAPSP